MDGLDDLRALLARGAMEAAPELLGCLLVRRESSGVRSGRIVETEAYTQDDPSAHSYGRVTPRNAPMYGPPGRAYVYFIYGMHYCINVVTAPEGRGEAVLIRAIEPVEGLERMIAARRWQGKPVRQLANGPGKVCQALGISREHNEAEFFGGGELELLPGGPRDGERIEVTPRIGITKAADWPRRFVLRR